MPLLELVAWVIAQCFDRLDLKRSDEHVAPALARVVSVMVPPAPVGVATGRPNCEQLSRFMVNSK